jgi:large repetitive protein
LLGGECNFRARDGTQMNLPRAALGVVALLALSACKPALGEGCAGVLKVSPGVSNAKVTLNSDGSRISVDFGPTLLETSELETLTLSNVACADMTFTKVATEFDDPSFSTDLQQGQKLVPGGAAVPVTIHFSPQSGGAKQDKIAVTTDSPFVPTIEFSLSGIGVATCLRLSPAPLDFGSVPTHQSLTKVVTMNNDCTNVSVHVTAAPVVLNDLPDGGTTSAGAFQPAPGFPQMGTVGPGKSLDFPIAFTPDSAGTFNGQLQISTDDANNVGLVVLLTATAR